MTVSAPDLSIVVVTRSRARGLATLLDSLRAQSLAAERYEVVVVDEGAGGPAAARNEGWRKSRAALVAFTTDECIATPGWAEAGLRAFARHPGAVIQGRVEINPDERDDAGPLSHTLEIRDQGSGFEAANVFYPRALLERLGGFDAEAFPRAGDDTDLGWRAVKDGAAGVFADDAAVYHRVIRCGAAGRLRIAAERAEALALYRRHPEVRAKGMLRRWFWRYEHWLFARFVLGLLLRPRLGLVGLMLAAPYIAHVTSRRGGLLVAPYLVVVDALEVGTLARGAIRHRTVVL